jgi:hypothetical protein
MVRGLPHCANNRIGFNKELGTINGDRPSSSTFVRLTQSHTNTLETGYFPVGTYYSCRADQEINPDALIHYFVIFHLGYWHLLH